MLQFEIHQIQSLVTPLDSPWFCAQQWLSLTHSTVPFTAEGHPHALVFKGGDVCMNTAAWNKLFQFCREHDCCTMIRNGSWEELLLCPTFHDWSIFYILWALFLLCRFHFPLLEAADFLGKDMCYSEWCQWFQLYALFFPFPLGDGQNLSSIPPPSTVSPFMSPRSEAGNLSSWTTVTAVDGKVTVTSNASNSSLPETLTPATLGSLNTTRPQSTASVLDSSIGTLSPPTSTAKLVEGNQNSLDDTNSTNTTSSVSSSANFTATEISQSEAQGKTE